MVEESLLSLELVYLFFSIGIAIELSKWLKIPSSVGLIVIGVAVGPSFLNLIHLSPIIHFLAEIGIIFLLFQVGLENDVSLLKSKSSIYVALFGFIIPFIGVFGLIMILDGNLILAIFLGITATATSIGITTSILKEMGVSEKSFSRTIFGAAITDDILGMVSLSFFTGIIIANQANLFTITWVIGFSIITLVVSLIIGTQLLKIIKFLSRKSLSDSSLYTFCIGLAVFASVLSENIGLSGIVGSFLIGLMIKSQSDEVEVEKIHHSFHNLIAVFSPVFFLSLGLKIEFQALKDGLAIGIILSIVAIITKFLGSYFGNSLVDKDRKISVIIGISTVPRGEIALVIANIGFILGILSSKYFSAIVLMSIITSFFPPFILVQLLKPYISAKNEEELMEMKRKVTTKWSMFNLAKLFKFVQNEKGVFVPLSDEFIGDIIKEEGLSEEKITVVKEIVDNQINLSKSKSIKKSSIRKIIRSLKPK
ncbi:MAG: cation:proton antiporter, partial [Candidatus Heimdallarchaeota archaeon]|nr:cation:proton antiporter [Candidatus Heimdallarchaeota archaeon]